MVHTHLKGLQCVPSLCFGELVNILCVPLSPSCLSVRMIDSCSEANIDAAPVLLVNLPSSGEGQGVMENRNAD